MTKEAQQKLAEYGSNFAKVKIANLKANNYFKAKSDEVVKTASEKEMLTYKLAEAHGRGVARGYIMATKEAEEISQGNYNVFMKMASIVGGDEFAEKLHAKFSEIDPAMLGQEVPEQAIQAPAEAPIEQAIPAEVPAEQAPVEGNEEELKAEISNGVAPVIIEELGGEEEVAAAIQENPELRNQILQKIDEVTEMAMAEAMNSENVG